MIALFRNEAGVAEATVHLALLPAGRYKLRSVLSGRNLGEFAQADWRRGVPVAFPANGTVQLLELQPLNG